MPGLRRVRARSATSSAAPILPTELFVRYEPFSFWERPAEMPPGVRMI